MAFEFKLPDVGEGLHEAEIVRWLVAAGDELAEDQPMVEIQTDKAVVEIASPVAGTVGKLHAAAGTSLPVGAILITIEQDGQAGGDRPDVAAAPPAGTEPLPPTTDDEVTPVRVAAEPAPTPAPAAPLPPAAAPSQRPVMAAPSTRRLARELAVALSSLTGTGPGGRIVDEDVLQAAARAQTAEPAGAPPVSAAVGRPPAETEERVPLRGLRRKIAEQMTISKTTIPHATHMDEVDVTELVQVRRQALPLAEEKGLHLTYLPFIIKAVVAGLRHQPELNATLDTTAEEIIYKHYYNIGIATDTADGLMVPVIKHADQQSIFALAAELDRLAAAARDRTIALDDLRGGTFTITNVGQLGGIFATPVINAPEAAILAVHRIRERPVVHAGQIVARHMLTLSLAFDHRIVDGAGAIQFLNRVMGYLAQPSLLFMELI